MGLDYFNLECALESFSAYYLWCFHVLCTGIIGCWYHRKNRKPLRRIATNRLLQWECLEMEYVNLGQKIKRKTPKYSCALTKQMLMHCYRILRFWHIIIMYSTSVTHHNCSYLFSLSTIGETETWGSIWRFQVKSMVVLSIIGVGMVYTYHHWCKGLCIMIRSCIFFIFFKTKSLKNQITWKWEIL